MKLHEITDKQHWKNRQRESIYKLKKGKIKIPWQFNYLTNPAEPSRFDFVYKYKPGKLVYVKYWTAMEWQVVAENNLLLRLQDLYEYLADALPNKLANDYLFRYDPAFDTLGKCFKLFLSPDWKEMNLTWPIGIATRGNVHSWHAASPNDSFLHKETHKLCSNLAIPKQILNENAETPPQFWQQYCSPY